MTEAIRGFSGECRFLSNFWPAAVRLEDDGEVYPSVEHAYQAAKFVDAGARAKIREMTAGQAKRHGHAAGIDEAKWATRRLYVMRQLLREKFEHAGLEQALLATGEAYLEETNTWGDTFWGADEDGNGLNMLGMMLMAERARRVARW